MIFISIYERFSSTLWSTYNVWGLNSWGLHYLANKTGHRVPSSTRDDTIVQSIPIN